MAHDRHQTAQSAPFGVARRVFANLLGRGAGQSLIALALLAIASVAAGLTLGENNERLEELPGLLLLVPAAIALRGNIFGALGSRLGTAIHAGTFRLSIRPASVVGQNSWASLVLTLLLSAIVAVLAKATAVAFGVADSISLIDFIVISVVGGVLASVVVLGIALALAAGSVRNGWDPDNVTAPLVTAAGDVVTLPALMVAAALVDHRTVSATLAVALVVLAIGATGLAISKGAPPVRSIIIESIPVLIVA
ncbi:MAG: magnesium transporter, partial [Acidimicrobiia bacterium]|nr:magnesium transporter [Acidimicrobiia bacterium]